MMNNAIRITVIVIASLSVAACTAQSPATPQSTPTPQGSDTPVVPLHEALKGVSQERIRTYIRALEGVRHPEADPQNLRKAQAYIETTLSDLGYQVTNYPFSYEGTTYQNVVATHPGLRYPEKRVLIIAHFDTVATSPGADDNASGVAVLLELANLLKPYTFEKTIQFVATNLEEEQTAGSKALAQQAKEENWQIEGVIDLEMVGYAGDSLKQAAPPGMEQMLPRAGNFIAVAGNETSKSLVDRFIAAIEEQQIDLPYAPLVVPGNGEQLPDTRRSDHAPFWDAGYQAILLTDTAEFRNEHYHRSSDTIDTLKLEFSSKVCQAVGELVNSLAVSTK